MVLQHLQAPPDAVVQVLNRDFVKAANSADIVDKLGSQGIVVATQSPSEFAAIISNDAQRLGKVIEKANIKLE